MLDAMRRGAQNIVVKIILILLASTFVLWGVGDMFRGRTANIVATVGDQEISGAVFSNRIRQETNRYQQMFGAALTPEQLEQFGVHESVLDQLINAQLVASRAQDLRFEVGNEAVKDEVMGNPAFAGEDGRFNIENFHAILRANGLNEESFIEGMKQDLSIQLFLNAFLTPPDNLQLYSDAVYLHRNEKRIADVFVLSHDYVGEIDDPAETDLVQFYQESPELFRVPEYRQVTYFTFGLDSIKDSIEVDEAELKNIYDSSLEDFKIEASRDLDQYLLESQEEAQSVYQSLVDGTTPEKAEKISLGATRQEQLLEEVREPVFLAEKGAIVEPIESPLGWHVFVVNDVLEAYTRPFEKVKEGLKNAFAERQAMNDYDRFIGQVEDAFAEGRTLEDVASQFDFIVKTVSALDRQGNGSTEKKIAEIPDPQIFLPLVFEMDTGIASSLTELQTQSGFVVARVDSITPQRVKALDEVKGNAIALWKEQQKKLKLAEAAQRVTQQLQEGKPANEVINAFNLTQEVDLQISRPASGNSVEGTDTDIPIALAGEVFALQEGEITTPHENNDGHFVVVRAKGKVEAEIDRASSQYRQIEEGIKRSMVNDALDQYTDYLKTKIDVVINQGVVNSAY